MRRLFFVAIIFFLAMGGVSATALQENDTSPVVASDVSATALQENDTLSIVAPGCNVQDDNLIIEINQTSGWMIAGPTGRPPSHINITVNPNHVTG